MKFRVALLKTIFGLGIFWDRKKRCLYFFPLPFLMFKLSFNAGKGRTKLYW